MPTYSVVAQSPSGLRVPLTLSIVSEFPAAKIGVQAFIRLDARQRHSAQRDRQLFEHWDAAWRISGRNDERSGVLLNITELQHQDALAGCQTCFSEHALSS